MGNEPLTSNERLSSILQRWDSLGAARWREVESDFGRVLTARADVLTELVTAAREIPAEIERLTAELAEWHLLKTYAKSLGQETYLELHARNKRLNEELADYRTRPYAAINVLKAECDRLRAALTHICGLSGRRGEALSDAKVIAREALRPDVEPGAEHG